MKKSQEILDVSDLPAPEPLQLVMKKLLTLQNDDQLIVRHRIEPLGLYKQLQALGYHYTTEKRETHFLITIWKKDENK